ncbi:Uncharacterized protein APZ42_025248 [Daphnia magna]|uniref:Uncharacterized protein n=1 Tax=Daphnia magna TaxID=35525 RepID=A0A162DDL9_9CRUS|nr:Uncharacterized protein APZ42_025248 [Daphnia magna]
MLQLQNTILDISDNTGSDSGDEVHRKIFPVSEQLLSPNEYKAIYRILADSIEGFTVHSHPESAIFYLKLKRIMEYRRRKASQQFSTKRGRVKSKTIAENHCPEMTFSRSEIKEIMQTSKAREDFELLKGKGMCQTINRPPFIFQVGKEVLKSLLFSQQEVMGLNDDSSTNCPGLSLLMAHFFLATIRHPEELASFLGPQELCFISQYDKYRLPIDLAAANKQSPLLMHVEYRISLRDHDWIVAVKHKLIPSVYAGITTHPNVVFGSRECVSFSGPIYIAVRSGKQSPSTAFSHAFDFEKLLSL